MKKWTIEYDNDAGSGDESFAEWWTVTDGNSVYRCNSENDAKWLLDTLNALEQTTCGAAGVAEK